MRFSKNLLRTAFMVLVVLCTVTPALADTVIISDITTLQATIDAAGGARTIEIAAGTYTLAANVNINKPGITIQGQGTWATTVQVSGTGYRFSMTAPGCTIRDLDLVKTDKTGGQDIIWINASNVTVQNNRIHGQFVIGEGEVARAMVISGGNTNLLITGNTIFALRQPAYFSGTANPAPAGVVSANFVYGTKGWVIEDGNYVFTANTWGTGANSNVYDVAILAGVNAVHYPDIVAMSNANNSAVIEDQRYSPAILSIVAVNASAPSPGTGGPTEPYQLISPAMARVAPGGKVNVAAGTYLDDVIIGKGMTLTGAGIDQSFIVGLKTGSNGATVRIGTSAPVVVQRFTITRDGNNVADWALNVKLVGLAIQGSAGNAVVRNNKFTGNRTGIDLNFTSDNLICNNIIDFNRSGLLLRNQCPNNTIKENEFTNNWTMGILWINASTEDATGTAFFNNKIEGNWYTQIENRSLTGGVKDFTGNWLGSTLLTTANTNGSEPGYAAQIPVAYGGTAVPPGGAVSARGAGLAEMDFTPWLGSNVDTNVDNGTGTIGFQGSLASLYVGSAGGQAGSVGRVHEGLAMVTTGGTIHLAPGTIVEPLQLAVTRDVSIIGAGAASSFLRTSSNTTQGGNVPSEAWIYNPAGVSLLLKDLALDGTGQQVHHAVQSRGSLTVEDCAIRNIRYGQYFGRGIVLYAGAANTVRRTAFSNIERIGIHVRGNVAAPLPQVLVDGVTYTGKGLGDWLDYGVEFGAGGTGTVQNSSFSACLGLALSDNSTSAGILATDYYGLGTQANVNSSVFQACTSGLAVGFSTTDLTTVTAAGNNFATCTTGITAANTGAMLVNAEHNWWGDATGPHDASPIGLYNPDGLGVDVTDGVDYDPWNGGNIVCSPEPQMISTADGPVGGPYQDVVNVQYLGGLSGPLYGFDIRIVVDPAYASYVSITRPATGPFASATLFQVVTPASPAGAREIHAALGGAVPGATGICDLFQVTFQGVGCTPPAGTPIAVTLLGLRDGNNAQLTGGLADDGVLKVDLGGPAITAASLLRTAGAPAGAPATYAKNGDQVTLTATVDEGLCSGLASVVANLTSLGGGAAVAGSLVGTTATWTVVVNVTPPGLGTDGVKSAVITATDLLGNTATLSPAGSITVDNTVPPMVSGFAAAPGFHKVSLNWSNPSGADPNLDLFGIRLLRKQWGGYPQYLGSAPVYPTGPADGTAVDSYPAPSAYVDNFANTTAARDICYYRALAYDAAGNFSSAAGTGSRGRATNYWLGDVRPIGSYDGAVDALGDIAALGLTYYKAPGDMGYEAECNVGPTHDASRLGIPMPQSVPVMVDFEDMMIFAMNYGVVTPARVAVPGDLAATLVPASLRMQVETTGPGELKARLVLADNRASVKGLHARIGFDANRLELVSVTKGSLTNDPEVFCKDVRVDGGVVVDAAVFGDGYAFNGSGVIAELTFRVRGAGARPELLVSELRDVRNLVPGTKPAEGEVETPPSAPSDVTTSTPAKLELLGARPNPFVGSTEIRFALAEASPVSIRIFDVNGRLVRTLAEGVRAAGEHAVSWDGRMDSGLRAGVGVYFYTFQSGRMSESQKLYLAR